MERSVGRTSAKLQASAQPTRRAKLPATIPSLRILLAATALWAAAPAAGLAQDATAVDAGKDKPAPGLETIMVTAQKRSENIKDVPLSVSVIGGGQLEEQHTVDYTDLAREVPGLSFSNEGGSGLNHITLRGVSSSTGASTVGMYLDDVSITMPNMYSVGATEPKFFDLDHVEVLRGPQGTLYGSSSMGGTIRFMTNQPELDTYSGYTYGELSGTEHGSVNYEAQGVANVPLVEGKAALRVGIDETFDSGYIDHVSQSGTVDDAGTNAERSLVLHAAVKLKPNDDLTITPSLFFQRTNLDDTSVFYTDLPKFEQDKLVREKGRDQLIAPSLTIDYDLHWADLTSVTGYFQRKFKRVLDGTAYNSEYLASILDSEYGTDNSAVAKIPGPVYNTPSAIQYSQELRLASKSSEETGRPYAWLGGLYFADQYVKMTDYEYMPGLGSTLESLYGESASDVLGVPLTNDEVANYVVSTHVRQYAMFGEASYNLTDALKFTAGLRYLVASTDLNVQESGYFAEGLPSTYGSSNDNYALTPKFAVSYAVTDTTTAYANAVKGFRLGSPNEPVPTGICGSDLAALGLSSAPTSYGPDSLWSYELGAKAGMLNNRVTVNGALYYIDWKNVQQSITLPTCGNAFTANAGSARSYGGELEVSARITHDLSVAVSAGTTNATLTSVSSGTGASVGEKLIGVPEWTGTIAADYRRSLTDRIEGFIRSDWDLVGPSHGSFSTSSTDYERPAYNVLNGSMGINFDNYEISLFVKNLLNEDKIIQRPALLFVSEGYTVRPLTVGASLRIDF